MESNPDSPSGKTKPEMSSEETQTLKCAKCLSQYDAGYVLYYKC